MSCPVAVYLIFMSERDFTSASITGHLFVGPREPKTSFTVLINPYLFTCRITLAPLKPPLCVLFSDKI